MMSTKFRYYFFFGTEPSLYLFCQCANRRATNFRGTPCRRNEKARMDETPTAAGAGTDGSGEYGVGRR